jgi:hypothetical protein
VLQFLGPGEIVGEAAFIAETPYVTGASRSKTRRFGAWHAPTSTIRSAHMTPCCATSQT